MHRHGSYLVSASLRFPIAGRLKSLTRKPLARSLVNGSDYASKYSGKLKRRAEVQGLSVETLREKIKKEEAERKQRKREVEEKLATLQAKNPAHATSASPKPSLDSTKRNDSSPVRALSSILNVPRLFPTPHTNSQISALWTTYHASRSNGTGRGYVCATIPVELYRKMVKVAERYSSFVFPIPRPNTGGADGEMDTAYEFYFLQWDFHGVPPEPSADTDPFAPPKFPESGLQTSTILFTPLQEYKLKGSFATPYFVLTQYTDLSSTHDLVLLRGEITPSNSSNANDRYLLTQDDAQLLAMAVQKFYLWDDSSAGQEKQWGQLLQNFHEKPDEFKWEDLLKHTNLAT